MTNSTDLNNILEENNMFFNLSVDILCVVTFDGKFKTINPAFSVSIGYTKPEIISKPISYFVHPDDIKKTMVELELLTEGKSTSLFENRYKTKTGEYKWFSWTASAKGELIYAVARDITSLKIQEKRADDLAISNKELEIQNQEGKKSANQLVIVNKELAFLNQEKIDRAGELLVANKELAFQNKEKEKRKEENKELEAYSYAANLASQYSLSLIEASRDPLVTISPKGKITDFNQAMVDITGTTREKLKGSAFKQYFTEPKKASKVYKEVFLKGFVVDYPLTIKDHQLTDVLFNGSVYRDENHNVVGAVIVARDVTEQKRITKELEAAKILAELATEISEIAKLKAENATKLAEDAVKSKQQFLSNMSHEIRTPMNAIIGFTKVVLKTELTVKQKEYLEAIKLSGDALIVLINDILDLAKVDSGKMSFEKAPFKLSNSISAMLQLFDSKIQEKNLVLVKHYDNKIPKILLGDAVRLHQIILNLVGNAVKFTNIGKITISTNLVEHIDNKIKVKFEITDTGIGISKSKIGSIFENFQQASSNTSRLFGGTGLGLAIVKQLVEGQGGTVAVNSELGHGSTFSFILDFESTIEDVSSEIDIFEMDTEIKNLKVLVVEDMELNQLLMKTLLDDFGFECEIASNGKIAVERLKTNTYDIVLMDLQMPEMNGFEATEYIRNVLKSKVPILALTADVTTVDVAKCKEVGMNDYLAKPVDEKLLYKKIVNLVKISSVVVNESQTETDKSILIKYVNLKYLNERTKSNPDLMQEMINLYLEQTPPLIQAMKQGFQNKDWTTLQKAVHKMIPSFAIMGIDVNFEKIAHKIQEYASTMQFEEDISDLVSELENVLSKSCDELREELQLLKDKK